MLLQYFILVHTHNEYNYRLHQPDRLCGSDVRFYESHFLTPHTHTVHKCYNNLVLHAYYIHANILAVLLACAGVLHMLVSVTIVHPTSAVEYCHY